MNKQEYLNKLRRELYYLTKEELNKEIECYDKYFSNKSEKQVVESLGSPKELARKIYNKRGIDSSKLNKNFVSNVTESFVNLNSAFKNKKNDTKKMVIDILYMFIIIILVKFPFDLVKDIGFNYLEILTKNSTLELIWNLGFLILYTVVALSIFVILVRNFSKKYLVR